MRRLATAVLAAGAVGALAACGGSGGSSSGSGGAYGGSRKPASAPASAQKLTLKADSEGGLYFEPRKLTGKAGAVTLVMDNPSSSGKQHGIAIEGSGVDKDGQIVAPGSKSTVTVTLKAGTYEFYCPVPAHKAAGMKGTLVVS